MRARRAGGVRWGILAAGMALVLPLLWILYSGFGKDPHALPDVMTGTPAPAFSLVTLDGEPVALEGLRGKPVVLNFWATWCAPCAQEHPVLLAGARRYQDKGVVFLGVLYGDTPEKARDFVARKGQAYPTLVDPEGRTAIDFGVAGVPETYFIDTQGNIARKIAGPVSMPVLMETVEGML